jgi:hypothetical protein
MSDNRLVKKLTILFQKLRSRKTIAAAKFSLVPLLQFITDDEEEEASEVSPFISNNVPIISRALPKFLLVACYNYAE